MHYARWYRNGDPEKLVSYADPEAAFLARTEPLLWSGCLIWMGATDAHGYGRIYAGRKVVPVHRYAWEREHGSIPEGMVVDHRYHCDPSCCEVSHLRLATRTENRRHQGGASRSSVTGVRNVFPHREGWFRVSVRCNGRRYGGTHRSLASAQAEAARLREELFGEFAGKG